MVKIVWAGNFLADSESEVLEDQAVVVQGNIIIDLGPKASMIEKYREAEIRGGDQYLLLPSFIDSHDHGRALGTVPLGVPDDWLEIWIPGLWAQPVIDCYTAAVYDGLRLLQSGVTAVSHHHNPRDWSNMLGEAVQTIKGYRDVGMRVVYNPPFMDQNQLVYEDALDFIENLPKSIRELARPFAVSKHMEPEQYFEMWQQLFQDFHDVEENLVHINVCPVGGQWISDDMLLKLINLAKEYDTRIQMHLLETPFQQIYAQRQWGKSFVKHLDEIDALVPWLTLAHMTQVEHEDLPVLAKYNVGIAINPSSNLRLRNGIAPIAMMEASKVEIGIGLDGHTLDDDQDYLREMRLARVLANRPGSRALVLDSRDILRMGTQNGAKITFGQNVKLGRLQKGYLADMVLIDFDAVRDVWFSPDADPVDILLHKGVRNHVTHVMVNGDWVIKDGNSISVNEEEVVRNIREQLNRQLLNSSRQQAATTAKMLAPYIRKYYQSWEYEE